jgi:hypothetical protein
MSHPKIPGNPHVRAPLVAMLDQPLINTKLITKIKMFVI